MKSIQDYSNRMQASCIQNNSISQNLYLEYNVRRGLRDENGKGVLTGLTNISDIQAFSYKDGLLEPCDGILLYRGYNIEDIVLNNEKNKRLFEEASYLLLFGTLPDQCQLDEFGQILGSCMELPTNFTRDVIMKAPSPDIMTSMTKSILTLASYDEACDDISISNVIRQCIQLIAVFPMLAVYAYHAHNHYNNNESMYIHRPVQTNSISENLLSMLRPDKSYSELEANVLDTVLLLHMEHGGGNNSTFTTRVVTSTGTDTYSAISAAMASLKGPKHGGANLRVVNMMDDIKNHVRDYADRDEIRNYLVKILNGETFDHRGLIYGMGHAVYSISDPRERILKRYVEKLAAEKGFMDDLLLYNNVEILAPEVIADHRHIYKGVSPNIDFYSGFVYEMLGIPREMYTPLFAIARIVGWSAHRLEELVNAEKIIRPDYKSLISTRSYMSREERKNEQY